MCLPSAGAAAQVTSVPQDGWSADDLVDAGRADNTGNEYDNKGLSLPHMSIFFKLAKVALSVETVTL